jgi:hypothetical protein
MRMPLPGHWPRTSRPQFRHLPCYVNTDRGWNEAMIPDPDPYFNEPYPVPIDIAGDADFVLIESETRSYLVKNGGKFAIGAHLLVELDSGRIVLAKGALLMGAHPGLVWRERYCEEERILARHIRRVIGTVVRRLDD